MTSVSGERPSSESKAVLGGFHWPLRMRMMVLTDTPVSSVISAFFMPWSARATTFR